MSPADVLALVVAIARGFGLAVEDVVAYARQLHPALRMEPLPDLETVDTARAEAVKRTS